jgi:hypothetical protein
MSRGPGSIETRIGDLFAASQDRTLSVDEIAAHAFALDGNPPIRAQRLSTIRAAHRVIRRTQEMDEKRVPLLRAAEERIRTALQGLNVADRPLYRLPCARFATCGYPAKKSKGRIPAS